MADIPDRKQIFGAFKRLSRTLLSLGLVLVFVLIALAIALSVFDPLLFQAVTGSPQNALADRARVFESTTVAVGCTSQATGNASVETYQLLGAHHLIISGNVTLPDASYVLTEPTIVERSDDRFVVVVESHPANSSKRGCQGLARYTAKIQLPYGTNGYELVIRHGDETLRVIERT